jgi:hypothetical protein
MTLLYGITRSLRSSKRALSGLRHWARHHPLKEAAAIVKLATKDVDQIVNGTPALEHQLLKFFEGYFSHCPPLVVKNIWEIKSASPSVTRHL